MTALLLLVPSLWLRDTVGAVGTGRSVRAIVVADGRNEGANRVYVKADTASDALGSIVIHEFGWSGAWSGGAAFSFVTQGGGGAALAVGNGRNDGVNRLYTANAGCPSPRFYEAVWNGAAWDTLGVYGGARRIVIGDGRNDGVNRVYCVASYIVEYTWSGAWQPSVVGSGYGPGASPAIALGDARNDGTNRIYGGVGSLGDAPYSVEYSLNGGGWREAFVGANQSRVATEAHVGALKPDGCKALYALYTANDGYSYMYEHRFLPDAAGSPPFSQSFVVGTGPTRPYYRRASALSAVGSDPCGSGRGQLFYANNWGEVYCVYWQGGDWVTERVDSLSDSLFALAVGVGRNDGVPRVYVAGAGGYVYELSCVPQSAEEAEPAQPLTLRVAAGALRFALPSASAVSLALYDASGRRCATLFSGTLSAGEHSFALPQLPRGVYVARLAAGGRSVSVTLVQ